MACWLAVLTGTAGPARAQGRPPPTPAALEEARKHMKAGAAFANDPSGQRKCEEALREFAKAYARRKTAGPSRRCAHPEHCLPELE